MGFDCGIREVFSFIYKADLDQEMTEHELDHVLIGKYNEEPVLNSEEVADWKWIGLDELLIDMEKHPEQYTVWFRIIFKEFREKIAY